MTSHYRIRARQRRNYKLTAAFLVCALVLWLIEGFAQ